MLSLLFFREFLAAVEVWNASTAYGHCYLIVPMVFYLLWDRKFILVSARPRSEFRWALLALPVAAAWLVAERLGIMEGRQLTAIAGFEVLFLVVLGWRLFWLLSGPLLYLFFLVPFGAFLVPALQRFTAEFSIVGLQLLGIPHYSDNFIIETPAGVFFVAEACAGLRFLIAAVAFGVFYALLNFRSPTRRVLFIIASIAIPIIANGFRALGIVVLGQILGSAEAAAADHIVYGWVFFSIVMLLLVAAGHPFREFAPLETPAPARESEPVRSDPFRGAFAAVIMLATGPALAAVIDAQATKVALLSPPPFQVPPGCERSGRGSPLPASTYRWSVRCGDSVFDLALTVFPARSTAREMIVERRDATAELGAENVTAGPLDGVDPDQGVWTLVQTTDPNRLTGFASWVDGVPVRSGLASRIAQARNSLLGADYAPVLITITTIEPAHMSVQRRASGIDGLRALLKAQPGLDREIERLSAIPGVAAPG